MKVPMGLFLSLKKVTAPVTADRIRRHVNKAEDTDLRKKSFPAMCDTYMVFSNADSMQSPVGHQPDPELRISLGCAKERQIGIFTQRIRCAWGIAAIRARARSREARRPLVGCSREQAGRLLAGSCAPAQQRRTAGQGQLELLDAITWAEDTGARMSREARAAA